jgi:hypothetical protein
MESTHDSVVGAGDAPKRAESRSDLADSNPPRGKSAVPGGMALRLARVKRYRPDKRAEDADTMEAVRRLFAAQGWFRGIANR